MHKKKSFLKKSKLPWEHPKPKSEEPHAKKLIDQIMRSPTYRLAEEDQDFLKSYDTRAVRLELDYLKAELEMSRAGIEHTIVVFGSARIPERKTALEHLEKVQKRLKKDPTNEKLIEKLYVAQRMLEKSIYYDDARMFGRYVSRCGKGPDDSRVVIMTGGGPGIMEAANRGAHDVGAKSVGLNINLPHEQFPNPYITPNLCFQFRYFAIRKLHFLNRAKALVVYPGGFGTFDELFETLTLIQTRKNPPIPVVLIGESYWKRAVDFDFLREEGVIAPNDLEIFHFAANAAEAWRHILHWHERFNTPLLAKGEKTGIEES